MVHLRGGRQQDGRRPGLGRRLEDGLFRLGVQGPARQPRQGLRAAPAVPRGPGQPAAADRLRHPAHRHPHQLHQHRQADAQSALDDLLEPARLELLRQVFTDPDALRPSQTPEQVTEKAAQQFGRLAELLRRYGDEPHAIAHFLIRLLFCLFAEDVDILPQRPVHPPGDAAGARPGVLTGQLRQLFAAMAAGGVFGADEIPHFDGGLFDDDAVLDLDSESRRILAEVSRLDWSAIEPSIFGTLFERSLDPAKRAQLGAHYTGEEDILLIVEPVLMAPLRRRWAEVQAEARAKAEQARSDGRQQAGAQEDQATGQDRGGVIRPAARLPRGAGRDPGAGRGVWQRQFPLRRLRLLLDLEKEVITLAAALGDSLAFPMVSPKQLHGIEINPYAHELAQATIWIGYIQWLRDNGFGLPEEPILKPLEAIRQMDAILAYDAEGKPVEPEWPEADVIVGNPPFLGGKKMRTELGDEYVEDLFSAVRGTGAGVGDLVCYWFEKARAQIEAGKAKRADCWRRRHPRWCQSQGAGADQGDRRHLLGAVRPRLDAGWRSGACLDGWV